MMKMKEIAKISSRDNTKLAAARRVRDGKVDGKIFIEGVRLSEEALRSDLHIEDCFISASFVDGGREREAVAVIGAAGIRVSEVSDNLFRSLADTSNTQGIILIAEKPVSGPAAIEQSLTVSHLPLVVCLYEINDPSNLGAIFRTTEAAGAAGIITAGRSADAFSPKAIRAAMGASFRVPVMEKAEMKDVAAWARDRELRMTAADITGSANYTEIDWNVPRMLVFGSEANGMSADDLEMMDEIVSVPMQNGVESLNLAVSAGIILFEAARQRSA